MRQFWRPFRWLATSAPIRLHAVRARLSATRPVQLKAARSNRRAVELEPEGDSPLVERTVRPRGVSVLQPIRARQRGDPKPSIEQRDTQSQRAAGEQYGPTRSSVPRPLEMAAGAQRAATRARQFQLKPSR